MALELKDQWVILGLKVALVILDPPDLLDLRVAPVSLVSKDSWVMLESLDSKERLDQKENLVHRAPRECSDLRVKKENEDLVETPAHSDLKDLWEREELLVTEGFLELMDSQDQREPKGTVE